MACEFARKTDVTRCTKTGERITAMVKAAGCPLGLHVTGAQPWVAPSHDPSPFDPPPPAPAGEWSPEWIATFHVIWAELHGRPFLATFDPAAEPAFLSRIQVRLPCGSCGQHWRDALRDTPPDLSSPEAYFAWTVARHNGVNLRLRKATWTIEEALAAMAGHSVL